MSVWNAGLKPRSRAVVLNLFQVTDRLNFKMNFKNRWSLKCPGPGPMANRHQAHAALYKIVHLDVKCFESAIRDPDTLELSHAAMISPISKIRGKIIPTSALKTQSLFVAAISRLHDSNRVTTKGP